MDTLFFIHNNRNVDLYLHFFLLFLSHIWVMKSREEERDEVEQNMTKKCLYKIWKWKLGVLRERCDATWKCLKRWVQKKSKYLLSRIFTVDSTQSPVLILSSYVSHRLFLVSTSIFILLQSNEMISFFVSLSHFNSKKNHIRNSWVQRKKSPFFVFIFHVSLFGVCEGMLRWKIWYVH